MCEGVSKTVLTIVNAVLAAVSVICFGVGIWVAVSGGNLLGGDVKTILGSLLIKAAILFIVAGILCLALSICGFVGALKDNTMLLIAYSIGLGILLVGQFVIIGLAASYDTNIENKLKDAYKEHLLPFNQLEKSGKMRDVDVISWAIHRMHLKFSCCGVNSYKDVQKSSWSNKSPTFKYFPMEVPVSCCNFIKKGIDYLTKTTDWTDEDIIKYGVISSTCPRKLREFQYNKQGCYAKLKEYIKGNIIALILMSCLFTISCIACIIMACCIIKN